ncbi:MAG: hypothetical protein LIR50_15940 [Bacillota bacterium]|nr:hypothetical protein [Bacillota bacterium]
MDNLKLLNGQPIKTDIGIIYQPIISEISKYGENEYSSLLLPYQITKDILLDKIPQNLFDELKTFDLFFIKDKDKRILVNSNNETYLDLLKESIKLFLHIDKFRVLEDDLKFMHVIELGNNKFITRDNFDKLTNYILQVNMVNKIEIDPIPKGLTKRQLDVEMKLRAGRKRRAEEEKLNISDICNVVQFGGKSFIPYSEISKMTILQLYNAFTITIKADSFNRRYSQYLTGYVDAKELHIEDGWLQDMKVDIQNK